MAHCVPGTVVGIQESVSSDKDRYGMGGVTVLNKNIYKKLGPWF